MLGLILDSRLAAQTFRNLHDFTLVPNSLLEGAIPQSGVILSSNTLYGTAYLGGSWRLGTIFKINTDGTGFTTLRECARGDEGALPYAGLILSGNTLYGTTVNGGSSGYGKRAAAATILPLPTVAANAA